MFKSRAAASVAPVIAPSNPQDAMKQTLISVVQLWLDRLQHQAVVTTFFVSIDSLLFSLTAVTRRPNLDDWSNRDMVINASLGGAIIFHVCASIVAYIASFVLIRYRLSDAERREEAMIYQPPPGLPSGTRSRGASTSQNPNFASADKRRARSNSHDQRPSMGGSTIGPTSPIIEALTDYTTEVFTDLRAMVSVYRTHPLWFLRRRPAPDAPKNLKRGVDPETQIVDDAVATLRGMVGTLSRAHTVCAGMATLGFVLALLGILTYSWTVVPLPLGIFASSCMGACGIVAAIALWPDS